MPSRSRWWADTLLASVLFVAGFSTVFVAFGASASAIGALVLRFSPQLAIVAGIAIIIMGLHFLGRTAHRGADAGKARRHPQAGRAPGAPT